MEELIKYYMSKLMIKNIMYRNFKKKHKFEFAQAQTNEVQPSWVNSTCPTPLGHWMFPTLFVN